MYAAAPSATGSTSGAFGNSAVGTIGVHADTPIAAVVVPYVHAVQSVEPDAENVLSGHRAQADEEEAPVADEYEPAAHN